MLNLETLGEFFSPAVKTAISPASTVGRLIVSQWSHFARKYVVLSLFSEECVEKGCLFSKRTSRDPIKQRDTDLKTNEIDRDGSLRFKKKHEQRS